ncbi:exodeoxyribonuclease V subunit gamma [Leptospira idonii]|uniref:Exonuclease V subunit gamma n=1 Tax=Leptospira idonii TaxID=1193500 RepID=A0A4R9LW89_9LEPT|nr:exodeoxyribonuclease V subunit gamma [Leptospira idonii]TGN17177.1 exonuclease V subunit gamma [Leptospira idonii]
MAFYHYTSLSLADLSSLLSKRIWEEKKKSPLAAPIVIIPNLNMRKWLDLHLAKISGLSTHIEYQFLEKFFERYYIERSGRAYNPGESYFSSYANGQRKIISYLLAEENKKELFDLSSYLTNMARVFSYSTKLTSLFKDYELNRSAWIEVWAKEKSISVPRISKKQSLLPGNTFNAILQKKIYQEVILDGTSSIPFFLQQRSSKPSSVRETAIHLFCLSNLADTYLGLLESLSVQDGISVFFYQFHNGSDRMDAGQSDKIVRWSKPQIEIASRIRNIKTAKWESIPVEKTFPKGLKLLRDSLSGIGSSVSDSLNGNYATEDGSVRFWNAPSVYREMEAVANDILFKMKNDSSLSYLDFAILLTDVNSYRSSVEWVFDGGILLQVEGSEIPVRKKIPYSLTDIKSNESSYLYRGLADLWEICSGRGMRKENLLFLLRNPLLLSRFEIDEETLIRLEDLIETLGVRYEEEGRDKEAYQISDGLKRARLSTVLDSDSAWAKWKKALVVLESSQDPVLLTSVVESLFQVRSYVIRSFRSGNWEKEMFSQLRTLLESVFDLSDQFPGESFLFQNWLETISDWEGLQLTKDHDGIEILKLLTEQSFEKIPFRKGEYLTGGVTISLLQPMRPIPFKHVYILGLGESKFPGSVDRSSLNLRTGAPENWDLNRREIQESLLWESVHSAQESITFSYVGKNIQEDKTFEPCSSLFEIMDSLHISTALEIPLHPYSEEYIHEEEDLRLGKLSFDFSRVWVNGDSSSHSLLSRFQDPKELEKLKASEPPSSVDLKELSRFLSDPLDTYLKKRMKMYALSDEEVEEEGEFFDLPAYAESRILKEVHSSIFPDLVSDERWDWSEKKLISVIGEILEKEKAEAKFPGSVFFKVKEKELLRYSVLASEILSDWKERFQGGTFYRHLSLGDTGLSESVCKKLPSLSLDLTNGSRLEIVGEWENVIEKDGVLYWLSSKSWETEPTYDGYKHYKDYWEKMSFPFLSLIAVSSQEESSLEMFNLKSRPKQDEDEIKNNSYVLKYKKDKKQAYREYLTSLAELYLQEDPVFFPRYAFLQYYQNEMFEKVGKKRTFVREKYEDEAAWKRFLKDEADFISSRLSDTVRLYPGTESLILKTSIRYAEKFYQPFLDWKL